MGLTSITKAFDPVVPITRAALIALQGAGDLVGGTTYAVTDAFDALGGTVTMFALSNTELESDGYWNFTANLGAQGRFMINSGNAGSINQITITTPGGPVNLLTAPVVYNTTRNQTAIDVVTAINANTLVSGFRAWVITSTTFGDNFDQPFIHYESLVGQTGFAYSLSVNATTLTLSNVLNGTLGFNSEDVQLECKYDLANDHIISAKDNKYNVYINTGRLRRITLGYNPVTTFRWNDQRLRNWRVNDSGVRDIMFRATATSFFRDIDLDNCIFEKFTSSTGQQFRIELRSQSTIRNVSTTLAQGLNMSNVRLLLNIQNIDCSVINITAGDGGMAISDSTFGNSVTRGSGSFVTTAGSITFFNNAYRGTALLQVANNVMNIGSAIRVQNNTWVSSTSRCIIAQNNLTAGLFIENNVDLEVLLVTNNVFQSNAQITNCTFTGSANQHVQSNSLNGPALGVLNFGDLCFSLNQSTFPFDVYVNNNIGAVYIQPGSTCSTTFSFVNNIIDNTYVFPIMNDCNIQYSTFISQDPSSLFINWGNPALPVNMTVIDSTVDTLVMYFCDVLNIQNSVVKHLVVTTGFVPFSTLIIRNSNVEHTLIDAAPDPITTATINNTSLIRGEYTTTYTHDFGTAPLNAGSPIYITDQFWGYVKEKASVTAWTGWVESVPGVTFELGDNVGSTYLSGLAAAVGAGAGFTQDTTLNPVGGVMTAGSVLEMRAVGGNITWGSAIIVISGKYMYPLP